MRGWAIDLGTTTTGVAAWDDAADLPVLVELAAVCRRPEAADPLEAPRLVPSAVHLLDRRRLRDRLGAWAPLERALFVGRRALIGRPALGSNRGLARPCFVPTFKHALAEDALQAIARGGDATRRG